MNMVPVQDVCFDDKATLAMGAAFDQAVRSLGYFARDIVVRELVAKRIIEVAKKGERNPIRLQAKALMGFSIDGVSMPVGSVGSSAPSPAYPAVAHAARPKRARLSPPPLPGSFLLPSSIGKLYGYLLPDQPVAGASTGGAHVARTFDCRNLVPPMTITPRDAPRNSQ